jgi:uroporphyrinogen III methyltransferase/synthase
MLARAAQGRDLLPAALKQAGAVVSDLALYDTVPAAFDHRALLAALQGEGLDIAVFTSASTVHNFMKPFNTAQRKRITASVKAACIGPVTAQAARGAGFEIFCQSRRASLDALAGLIERQWAKL